MVELDPTSLSDRENYRIMTTATTPRPIGWVSTISPDGVDNIAPFSHYNNVCTSRPIVMFSADFHDEGGSKDTVANIVETEEFVVNVVTTPLVTQMVRSADDIPSDVSEFEHAGITRAASTVVTPPRVADAAINLECVLYDLLEVYDREVVFGEVVHYHISDEILTDGKVDMLKVPTVGRLGGNLYTSIDPVDYTEIPSDR